MSTLEETLAQAVEQGRIPQAVVFATNADGSFTYKHATGKKEYPEETAIEEDACFFLASQTKLLTSIAALQVVEAGLFRLDDDVAKVLPELAQQQVLHGFDENDKPVLTERKNPITLKHLLTHSSGVGYTLGDETLMKVVKQLGREPGAGGTVEERMLAPLLFEPGTAWQYGGGIDWAGRLVERLTGMTLEEFMHENMWKPLGITSITFWPEKYPELKSKVPGMSMRTPDGGLMAYTGPDLFAGITGCFGGQGAYATLGDYLKVLRSILANDGTLLKSETVEMMFQPQLTPESAKALNHFQRHHPMGKFFIGEFNDDVESNWGLGGLLFMQDDVGKRKKYTLNWGGMANCFWIIDREADLALTYGTQVMPPGDGPTKKMISAVELEMYKRAGVKF